MKDNNNRRNKATKGKAKQKGTYGPRPLTDPTTILDPAIRAKLFGPVKQG